MADSKKFKLIENGKLNSNYPKGYNLLTGHIEEKNYKHTTKVFHPDIQIITK